MAEVVFVLGAGASRQSGAPLMAHFLDVAEELWRTDQVGSDGESFKRVFKGIAALKSVHAQLALDTNNLETVFSAFEMGAMIGKLGGFPPEEVPLAAPAMARVITRTLVNTVRLPVDNGRVRPPESYERFVDLLQTVRGPRQARGPTGAPAIITLNYDLGLDYALHWSQVPHAYGVREKQFTPGTVRLLKLHGSLNWALCRKCEEIVPWDLPTFFSGKTWNVFPGDDEPGRTVMLDVPDHLGELKHDCGEPVHAEPVVVPPTWNKTDNHLLRSVWRHAATELSQARYLVFIGYSFPETDLYFRYLLALGLAGDTRIRSIIVINPDPAAADRLKAMLGVGVLGRLHVEQADFYDGLEQLPFLLDVSDRE